MTINILVFFASLKESSGPLSAVWRRFLLDGFGRFAAEYEAPPESCDRLDSCGLCAGLLASRGARSALADMLWFLCKEGSFDLNDRKRLEDCV